MDLSTEALIGLATGAFLIGFFLAKATSATYKGCQHDNLTIDVDCITHKGKAICNDCGEEFGD